MKRTPLRRRSKNPRATLEDKLWILLSNYIRSRDNWKCFTCGARSDSNNPKSRREMHAGHFIQSYGHSSTRYDPRNIHAQCVSCNKWKHGNLVVYTMAMQHKYGVDFVKKLYAKSNLIKQWSRNQLYELIGILAFRPEDYEKEYDKIYEKAA